MLLVLLVPLVPLVLLAEPGLAPEPEPEPELEPELASVSTAPALGASEQPAVAAVYLALEILGWVISGSLGDGMGL